MSLSGSIGTIAVIAVACVLAAGLWNILRNGSANRSQKLMRLRVVMQLIAIVVLMTGLYIAKGA